MVGRLPRFAGHGLAETDLRLSNENAQVLQTSSPMNDLSVARDKDHKDIVMLLKEREMLP